MAKTIQSHPAEAIKELKTARDKMPYHSDSWWHYNKLHAAAVREWRKSNTLKGVK